MRVPTGLYGEAATATRRSGLLRRHRPARSPPFPDPKPARPPVSDVDNLTFSDGVAGDGFRLANRTNSSSGTSCILVPRISIFVTTFGARGPGGRMARNRGHSRPDPSTAGGEVRGRRRRSSRGVGAGIGPGSAPRLQRWDDRIW